MARKGKVMSQKKKPQKQQAPKDFQKAKVRVGKKKEAPKNDTKTDFRVKQMQMPTQAALDEKGDEVTERGLALPELLAHIGHHSPKVREEAFHGLHELCSNHPDLLLTNLARILDASTMAALDMIADVREAFRKFQAWMIEALPAGSLVAFAPILAMQIRSALSHVSSEIREDGLLLLELYASRLSGAQVLSQAESSRIVQTLCQVTTRSEMVLRCLHRLLRQGEDDPSSSVTSAPDPHGTSAGAQLWLGNISCSLAPQLSLHSILSSRPVALSSDGLEGASDEVAAFVDRASIDSPIWEFCLRAWLQAGEMPTGGGGRTGTAAAQPGWIRLRCAAVLERALDGAAVEATATASGKSVVALRPSNSQLAALVGVVRRGEWPLQVDRASWLSTLVDSVNLRMARVLALLASGEAPEGTPPKHLTRLACASVKFLDEYSSSTSASASGSAGATAANLEPDADVGILNNAAGTAYALRSLALLWASTVDASCTQVRDGLCGGQGYALGPEHYSKLVTITTRFISGTAEQSNEATASAILAVPLAASLLGLSLNSSTLAAPMSVRPGWPSALATLGKASFIDVVEGSCPGAAVAWVSVWPKLLWYLGNSDPSLSAFLLSLLLELSKFASRVGGLHEHIFTTICPLLMPFMVGRPGSAGKEDVAPPLAQLTRGLSGAQGLAAAMIPHFPKISDGLAAALTRLICRWSDIGLLEDEVTGKAPVIGLGGDCCQSILEALLNTSENDDSRPLRTRLRIALTVLCAFPHRTPSSIDQVARVDIAALRMADALAGWLMSRHCNEASVFPAMSAVSFDDRRRLALQSLAWPLCQQGLAVAPTLALRMLCFLFFCAVRLPNLPVDASKPADLDWRIFLSAIFDILVCGGMSIGGGAAIALCTSTLCDPARANMGVTAHASDFIAGKDFSDGAIIHSASATRLGQLFVVVWMKAVAAAQKPAAYELLTKICAAKLAGITTTSLDPHPSTTQIVSVLAAAIACRNELSLPTTAWGSEGPECFPALVASGPEALRAEITAQLKRLSVAGQNVDELKAMIPLL